MKWRGGYKYQVAETFSVETKITPVEPIITHFISLTLTGLLTVTKGYAWDGASGPAFDREIDLFFFKIKLTDTQVPSCVHDALAQLMRQELLPLEWLPYVNQLLDTMLKERRMTWLRRQVWKHGLWLTAGSFASPSHAKQVFLSL